MNPLEEQVVAMLAEERGVPASSVTHTSRLLEDLGMDGDDAVAFFRAFEARFSPDLTALYDRWPRHFGPEGLGWPDIRLNWLMLAGGGVLAVGIAGVKPLWSVLIGAAILLATTATGLWMRHTALPHLAVTVDDLIVAATTRWWPVADEAG